MTISLEEHVARAICKARGKNPDDPRWVRYPGPTYEGTAWHEHEGDASAAIAAVCPATIRESERAACEAIAWDVSRGWGSDAAHAIADAIAARKDKGDGK